MADIKVSSLTELTTIEDQDELLIVDHTGAGLASKRASKANLLKDHATTADLDAHEADTANPHQVTASQVGAPTTAQLSAHTGNTSNPHSVTKAQVGLSNVQNVDSTKRENHTGTQTASTISDFDDAVEANDEVSANTASRHSHPNKALLDTYTQTEANLADAVDKKHAHANQTVLDNTTASFTTALKNIIDSVEEGAEVNDVSQADIANFETTTQLNARDTANRSRSNHTGSQAISTVTGLQTALNGKADTTDLAEVATTGDYTDLSNTPSIPDALTDLDTTVTGSQLNSLKSKVDGIAEGAEVNAVDSVNSQTGVVVLDIDDVAPTQAGNTGKVLTTDGTNATWQEVEAGDALPDQTGNSGKFLTTDGTDPSWADLPGGGDMAKATYDPTNVAGDAFDMDNMAEGTTNKILTAAERSNIASAVQPGDLATVATTGDYTDLSNTPTLGTAAAADTGDFATAAQGSLADTAVQPAAIADFETTTELNARDTANRSRSNHTGTQPLSTISDVTATASEVNTLDGLTASTAELNYVDGVTSAIQTQLDGKAAASHTHTASQVTDFDTEVSNNTDVAANTADRHDSHVVGTKTVDETDIADGKVLQYNATSGNLEYETPSGGGSGISNVVEDTTPQLGGNLDLNGNTVGDASAADLTKLSQLTATSTELNYVDGVTSAIQTQLNAKFASANVIDEDDMASDSATKVPTQQSVKAYVDANAGGGGGGGIYEYLVPNISTPTDTFLTFYVAGDGSASYTNNALQLSTGTSSNSSYGLRYSPASSSQTFNYENMTAIFSGYFNSFSFNGAYGYAGVGIVYISSGDFDFSSPHMGITRGSSSSAPAYVTNGNGTSETKTEVSLTNARFNLTMVTTDSSIKYYDGATLLATHTTNRPTGTVGSYLVALEVTNVASSINTFLDISNINLIKKVAA